MLLDPAELAHRLDAVRGLVFDWDGVFNDGHKSPDRPSGFSEADSMGINMLRYGLWRRDGGLPPVAVITGEHNDSAHYLANRECFDALYQGVRDKRQAIAHFCTRFHLENRSLVCVYDDINDLAMAAECGIRVLVGRNASFAFRQHVVDRGYCDYITGNESGRHAIREVAELLLSGSGLFADVVESRVAYDAEYARYLSIREQVHPELSTPPFG